MLSDPPESILRLLEGSTAQIIRRDGLKLEEYAKLAKELTGGKGFDDIIVLDPRSAERVGEIARLIARLIARRGTLNLVGSTPLDGLVQTDLDLTW